MAIVTAFCNSAKTELLTGTHDFTAASNVFKVALYTSAATLGADTTAYAATNEAAVTDGGSGYTAGGAFVTTVTPTLSGTTAYVDFDPDTTWTLAGGTTPVLAAQGCLVYNEAAVGNNAISTHLFAGTPEASGIGATFTIQWPAAGASAILTLA